MLRLLGPRETWLINTDPVSESTYELLKGRAEIDSGNSLYLAQGWRSYILRECLLANC